MSPEQRGPRAATALVWLCAAVGLWAMARNARDDRQERALWQVQANPFGEGRLTRLASRVREIEADLGHFTLSGASGLLPGDPVEVRVRFAGGAEASFRVTEDGDGPPKVEPLDDGARKLAARLASPQSPPSP